ncbi:MAG: hypothetical protein KDA44_13930 [Planctomycetales bacterium]|nr:hypothetical protein [Planctomycetales bacterium]
MAGIIPIPNFRISGLLARQRLTTQLQGDQLDLFRLQEQISTGRRITLPSEDGPAALRAIALQRLLERKTQLATNVQTGQSYLGATDTALSDVATLLGDLRGSALGVAGTASTDEERNSVIAEVNRALEQLVQVGNRKFRGRYLFAGSQTNVQPYSLSGDQVLYSGNDKTIRNFSDIDVLFDTNASGQTVFGGISDQVLGGVNLDPQLSANTRLSALNGGRGISPNGALSISDGSNTVVVDISSASTVGDVARLIEANPPAGRVVTVTVTGKGLQLDLDASGGGNLTVREVASGKTARELGILEETGVLTGPLVGGDLDPVVLKTTRLDDLLGSKASALLTSAGSDNDLLITAAVNGVDYNGVAVQVVDDSLHSAAPGIAAGGEYAQYDTAARAAQASLKFTGGGNDLVLTANTPGTAYNGVKVFVTGQAGIGPGANATYDALNKRLTVTVDNLGATTVDEVVNAINGTGVFTAAHDSTQEATYNPAATIAAADIANVTGDTGNTGGAANTLYVYVAAGSSTANQVAAAINSEGTFTAALDAKDTSTATAAGTGVVALAAVGSTAGGSGDTFDKASGIRVVNGEQVFTLDFSQSETVEDLLNVLNGSDAGLLAEINADRTGVNVRSRLSGTDFQIGENGGQTATQLGLRSLTGATKLNQFNYGVGIPTQRSLLLEPPPATTPVNDFTIVADDGAGGTVDLDLDISAAETVQDVIDLINNHAQNNTGGIAIEARLTGVGNGIEIVDANGRPLTLRSDFGSRAAEYLGLIPEGETEVTDAGGAITGTDRHYLETDSVFTTLTRLRDALANNDITAIERAIAGIDSDITRVTFARSDVGARQQALELSQQNLQDEDVQLRSALSDEIDVDLVEAISNLAARQASLQASLQTTANILQLSLLNFL